MELGAGDGIHFSNCKLLIENGWNGLSIDLDNHGNKRVKELKISIENISKITKQIIHNTKPYYGIDFLSIDIDGNDYWILQEIFKQVYPKCICLEVNSQLPKDKSMVINYDSERIWDGSFAYGMSYKAAFDLLNYHGYQVIRNCNNTNLIAVKNLVELKDCQQTWSHPENMPENSYWQEIITLNKK